MSIYKSETQNLFFFLRELNRTHRWSSSVHRNNSNNAWLFNSNNGNVDDDNRSNNNDSVRCVAR